MPGQSHYKRSVVTDVGWEGLLRNLTSTQPELGPDITSLTVKADTSQSDILHITITDLHDERWHVPPSLFSQSSFGACLLHLPTSKQQCLTPMKTSKSHCACQLACRWPVDISSGQTKLQLQNTMRCLNAGMYAADCPVHDTQAPTSAATPRADSSC